MVYDLGAALINSPHAARRAAHVARHHGRAALVPPQRADNAPSSSRDARRAAARRGRDRRTLGGDCAGGGRGLPITVVVPPDPVVLAVTRIVWGDRAETDHDPDSDGHDPEIRPRSDPRFVMCSSSDNRTQGGV